jgi:hypothetical protein
VKVRTKSLVEGYLRWRDAGGKPGPRKGLAQGRMRIAPRMTAADKRRRALAAVERQEKAMAEREWWDNELIRSVIPGVLEYNRERMARAAAEAARKPRLVVSHEPAHEEAPEGERAPTRALTLVHDADALAKDVTVIGQLAMARIKETLSRPFDPADPNYQALLRFTSGVYNSTMTTMLRADENLLRARAVDRLPELLERVAEEERKRCERRLSIDVPPDGA